MTSRISRFAALLCGLALALAACSSGVHSPGAQSPGAQSPGTQSTGGGTPGKPANPKVVIATHDSWAAPKAVIAEFEKATGYSVSFVPSGDAGELTNKLVLTKNSPIADGVYGIDNTFASRAVDASVLAKYHSPGAGSAEAQYELPTGADYLTPIDWADVCVNVDDAWFAKHNLAAPASLADLVKPAYKNLFVTAGAATSSPGFAFLLATIATYGADGWQDYWRALMKNGAKLTAGWSDAFEVDYTAGGGNGDRPIVVSYNSDPVFSIPASGGAPTTHALLDTCFRQTEYAGVLAGAKNPLGAQAFIDFMTGTRFQRTLPQSMYVFPVNPAASLPADWAKWAPAAPDPLSVDPEQIASNRQQWLTDWSDITA